MGHSRLCEYQGGVYLADSPTRELIVGVKNVKEAKRWIEAGQTVTGQAAAVKVVMWPQTAKAKHFCACRGDYIEVTANGVRFCDVGSEK